MSALPRAFKRSARSICALLCVPRQVAAIAGMIHEEFPGQGVSLSGIGGVNTGGDAAEFILLGSDTVQVCSGIMMHGYPLVKRLAGGMQAFMQRHGFSSIAEFKGALHLPLSLSLCCNSPSFALVLSIPGSCPPEAPLAAGLPKACSALRQCWGFHLAPLLVVPPHTTARTLLQAPPCPT